MGAFYIPTRRILYKLFGVINNYFYEPYPNLSILCYHSIDNDGWDFSVRLDEFEKQINYLSSRFSFVSLNVVTLYL